MVGLRGPRRPVIGLCGETLQKHMPTSGPLNAAVEDRNPLLIEKSKSTYPTKFIRKHEEKNETLSFVLLIF